nr:hypothetical protein Itr_chr01CG06340 [Ipomoea trifida]
MFESSHRPALLPPRRTESALLPRHACCDGREVTANFLRRFALPPRHAEFAAEHCLAGLRASSCRQEEGNEELGSVVGSLPLHDVAITTEALLA